MSITINGATNTLTAASGLTIAGNTAVTGTLSATGVITKTNTAATLSNFFSTTGSTTEGAYARASNTSGTLQWGIEGAAGGGTLTGASAYSGFIGTVTNTDFHIQHNNTVVGTFSATALTLSSGVNLVMASGKGIDFSATSNGSGTTTSEVLSDYEEGTWTPALSGAGTAGTFTYTTQYGTYTKIGNLVSVSFTIVVNTVSVGATGSILISGLPFTSASASASYRAGGSLSNISGIDVNGTAPLVELGNNNTSFTLYGFNDNAAFGSSDAASIGNSDFLNGSITYRI